MARRRKPPPVTAARAPAPWRAAAGSGAAVVALVAVAAALYGRSLSYPLVFDDFHLHEQALGAPQAFDLGMRWLSSGTFGWIHRHVGADIAWQRALNIALHAGVGAVLFGFLARLFAAALPEAPRLRWLAFLGAAAFVAHPVSVYAVAYLMQRSIVMAALFSLAMLWCVLEGLVRRSAAWHVAALAAYLLAVSSKEHAVMMPVVAFLLALLLRDRVRLGRQALLAALAGAALGLLVAFRMRGVILAAYEPLASAALRGEPLSYPLSVIHQATLFFRYLLVWLVPNPGWMSIDWRTPFPSGLASWHAAGFLAWLAYAGAGVALLLRRGRLGLAGFAMLCPWVLSLTEFVTIRVQEPFVLYRSYLWMAAVPAGFAVLAPKETQAWTPALIARAGALAMACVALAFIAADRLDTFSSATRLWDDAVRKQEGRSLPYAERAYVNRGAAYFDAGAPQKALADFDRAVRLNPAMPDARLGRGSAYLSLGRPREAREELDAAIALLPGYGAAYDKRCIANGMLRRYAEALADCERAAQLTGQDSPWVNRAAVLRALGRDAEAAQSYERALQIAPRSPAGHYNYGVLHLDGGRPGLARLHFDSACGHGHRPACEALERLDARR